MNDNIGLSSDLLDFLRGWEGRGGKPVPISYLCDGDKWTIGYGHTEGVGPAQHCTEVEAEAWLFNDAMWFVDGVRRLVTVPLEQFQFDALVAFAYNVGLDEDDDDKAEGLGDSTLLKCVNSCRFDAAALQFPLWCHAGGKWNRGLERRRIAELAMWRYGDYSGRP